MLRIGFDAKRLFNNFTGLGNYSRTLLKNLAEYFPDNIYFLYTPRIKQNEETHYFLNAPSFQVKLPRQRIKLLWRSVGMNNDLEKDKIQLFHGLSHEIPYGLPKTGITSIVTIHDLIFKRYPKQYKPADRKIYDLKYQYACKHAQKIIAISESTKKDIVDFYNISPDKIEVVYQSCHARFQQENSQKTISRVLRHHGIPEDYMLYVGSIIERKNLLGIVKALKILPNSLRLPLVIVGSGGAYKKKVQNFANQNGLDQYLYFVQPDFEELPALYQQAQIFLYPSFSEGFGIPVLEALFSKTPVITSNISSLPEVAGPDSCQVDPGNSEAIAHGIERILTDDQLRASMVEKGLAYAQHFKAQNLTQKMMAIYESFNS